jgi:Domain of unknown function (DUF4376)
MAQLEPKKTYAIIQNGKVHSVFKGAALPFYNEKQVTVVPAGKDWKAGDEFVGGKHTPRLPDLEEERQKKVVELTEARDKAINGEFEFKGRMFKADQFTYDYMVATAAFSEFTGKFPDRFFCLDAKKEKVPLNREEAKQLALILMERAMTNFEKFAELHSQIASAKTVEELKAGFEWA